jgi:hypothetical protein
MEHVVIFACIQMQLQTVLCYTYDMIFITIFKIKHKLYTASGSAFSPSPTETFWLRTWCQIQVVRNNEVLLVIMVIKQLRKNRISVQNSIHLLKLKKKIQRKGMTLAYHQQYTFSFQIKYPNPMGLAI